MYCFCCGSDGQSGGRQYNKNTAFSLKLKSTIKIKVTFHSLKNNANMTWLNKECKYDLARQDRLIFRDGWESASVRDERGPWESREELKVAQSQPCSHEEQSEHPSK